MDVAVGNPVIHPFGVVGRVILTTQNRAQVMFYSHPNFRVSAKILDSRATGIIRWDLQGNESMIMDYVPLTIPVQVGQQVVTSGFSESFPENIPIGTIDAVERVPDQSSWILTVRPSVDLNRLAEGFVVLNQEAGPIQEEDSQ